MPSIAEVKGVYGRGKLKDISDVFNNLGGHSPLMSPELIFPAYPGPAKDVAAQDLANKISHSKRNHYPPAFAKTPQYDHENMKGGGRRSSFDERPLTPDFSGYGPIAMTVEERLI
ncbi:unnamed protein product [Strongylus vulgaris]|uniref:Uncharacterized protein n=1 Tax=Strongylus vulgaris TaxID=40348 RepID=A0A3P7LG02_STRVU|nr:unnamed protein product [Strongylus vulgaris]